MNLVVWMVFFLLSVSAAATECELYAVEKHVLQDKKRYGGDVETFSRSLNSALKTSADFMVMIDRFTLGLASAAVFGSLGASEVSSLPLSFENTLPSKWSEARFPTTLLYHHKFSTMPIRGAKVNFKTQSGAIEKVTGTKGELFAHFEKLVPYNRLRLFPHLTLEAGKKRVRTVKVPIGVSVESKVCSASTRLHHLPISPLILILTKKDGDGKRELKRENAI